MTSSISTLHDREEDTFFLTIGNPQEAIYESVDNRLYLRLDPDTLKIVGVEIPHVSRRLKDDPRIAALLQPYLAVIASESGTAEAFAQTLRELAMAS